MPEIGSSGLMSGDGKRGVGHRPQATAPILDSTEPEVGPSLAAAGYALIRWAEFTNLGGSWDGGGASLQGRGGGGV